MNATKQAQKEFDERNRLRQEKLDILKQKLEKGFMKLFGIPDLSDPEKKQSYRREAEAKVTKWMAGIQQELEETPTEDLRTAFQEFKKELGRYNSFLAFLYDNDTKDTLINTFIDPGEVTPTNTESLSKLSKTFKLLKYKVRRAARCRAYVRLKMAGMEVTNEHYDDFFKKCSRDNKNVERNDLRDGESYLLDSEESHAVTLSSEIDAEEENEACNIAGIIDRYIASDEQKYFSEGYTWVKTGDSPERPGLTALPKIREAVRKMENQEQKTKEFWGIDPIDRADVPFILYEQVSSGLVKPQESGYYRGRENYLATTFYGTPAKAKSLYWDNREARLTIYILFKKWRELMNNNQDTTILTHENMLRVLFMYRLKGSDKGYEIIYRLIDHFFNPSIKKGEYKTPKILVILDELKKYRNQDKSNKTKAMQFDVEMKEKIVQTFGKNKWYVYLIREIKGYSVRETKKELRLMGIKVGINRINETVQEVQKFVGVNTSK